MKILVTGNMGYVGSVLIQHLRKTFGKQLVLVGFDAGYFGSCLTLPQWDVFPESVVDIQHYGDVRDVSVDFFRGFDAVIHLAAISNDPMGKRFESVTGEINSQASIAIARLAASAGVKSFVFASSCSVYGLADGAKARTEQDAVNPLTAYARSKIDTEQALRQADLGDLKVRCLRFATACGMSPRLRLDLVLNDFVACALATGEITVLSDGSPWRPLIDVADMARAIEWGVGESANPENFVVVNVGTDKWNLQVRDIANAVASAIPGTKVSINSDARPDPRSYRVDFSLWRKIAPDHQPMQSLEGSIARVRDGLQLAGFADRDFRTSSLVRLSVLNRLTEEGRLDERLHWLTQ